MKIMNNTIVLKSFDCSDNTFLDSNAIVGGHQYCSSVHDGIMCWPDTPPGLMLAQYCPMLQGFNPSMLVYRKCGENGSWENFDDSFVVIEKTNYDSCLQATSTSADDDAQNNMIQLTDILRKNNILGIVLVLLSLLAILLSFILYKLWLPKYMNDILRVKIHKHLFAAVAVDMMLKFVFQISLLLAIDTSAISLVHQPIICEILITLNQYSEITFLFWIVIDCHFIHISARSGFLCISGYLVYVIIGWGTPIVPTLIWAMTLTMSHKVRCWQGHVTLPSIWIIETSKMLCLLAMITFICLSSYKHYRMVSNRSNKDLKTVSNITISGIVFAIATLTFMVTMIPTHVKIESIQHKIVVQYLATILTSTKGIYITILCNYSNIKDYVRKKDRNPEINIEM